MGVIAESSVISILDLISEPLSMLGITNPLYDKVMEADFEVDPSQEQTAAITAGVEILQAAAAQFSATEITPDQWSGPARMQAVEVEHCTAGFLETLVDMYIMQVEVIVQVIDYLIDIIRYIVKACELLLGLVIAIAAAAVAASVITAGGSFVAGAAAAAAALGSTFWAVAGLVLAIAVLGNILVWAIDQAIEWLQDLLAAARERGCLQGEAPLPDWDPPPPQLPW